MNQIIKFPDMRPPADGASSIQRLPGPAEYRRLQPSFGGADADTATQRVERKRHMLWLGLAIVLHAALFTGLWLAPPLRLKWNPSPDAWVTVTAVPAVPTASADAPPSAAPGGAAAAKPESPMQPGAREGAPGAASSHP